jgi:hypothetical protein
MGTLPPPHVKLQEFVTLRCALGIRFRDTATTEIVRTGLQVKARPVNAPVNTVPVVAQSTPSGVWVFYGLPGLRTFELGTRDFPQVGSPPGPPRFRIQVEDEEDRFLPCTFVATAAEKGPMEFAPPLSSPPEGTNVPLFSAPSRPVPPACAVIRAHLITLLGQQTYEPARWALVEARAMIRNVPVEARGLANDKGDVAVMFPWPELFDLTASISPPGGLHNEPPGWDVDFAAWYDLNFGDSAFADLDAILPSRAGNARELLTQLSPPETFNRATLRYGRELIVPEIQTPDFLPPESDPDEVCRALLIAD